MLAHTGNIPYAEGDFALPHFPHVESHGWNDIFSPLREFSLLNGNSLCATHNVPALNQEHLQRMSSRMPRQSVAHDFLKPELYMQCSQPTYLQSNHTYLCTLREEKTSKPTKEGSEVRHGRVKTKGDSKKGSRCVSSSCHISWAASVSTSGSHQTRVLFCTQFIEMFILTVVHCMTDNCTSGDSDRAESTAAQIESIEVTCQSSEEEALRSSNFSGNAQELLAQSRFCRSHLLS